MPVSSLTRRLGVGVAALLALAVAAPAAPAHADYDPGCVNQFWMYGLRGTNRSICDGPIQADGSWMRARSFYSPQYWASGSCSRYYCSLGYWVPEFYKQDLYRVTPETVLPDEPGHIPEGAQ